MENSWFPRKPRVSQKTSGFPENLGFSIEPYQIPRI
jgi:hypothetical protein